MKAAKVWAALRRYDRELDAQGYKVKQFERQEYDIRGILPAPVLLAHCRWMAGHCLQVFRTEYEAATAALHKRGWPPANVISSIIAATIEAQAPLEKAMRWLCYIQGVCHTLGLYSCNDLRDHSRGDEGTFKTAAEEHGTEPGVIAMGGPPPESMINPNPPSPAQLVAAANLLAAHGFVKADPTRQALDTPQDERTPEQVRLLKGSVFGCCDRHADNQGCSCMEEAVARDRRYGELEKEHLGDPEKKTGVYAPKVGPAQVEEIKKIAEKQSFSVRNDPPPARPPQHGYGASSDADWDAE